MKYLYRFYWDCGSDGDLEGLFVATEREIINAMGQEVNFGSVLGKHSEVYGTLEEVDIQKLNVSPDAVSEVSKYLGSVWSGFNPLGYLKTYCDECKKGYTRDEHEEGYAPDGWDCEYREEFDRTLCYECMEKLQKK